MFQGFSDGSHSALNNPFRDEIAQAFAEVSKIRELYQSFVEKLLQVWKSTGDCSPLPSSLFPFQRKTDALFMSKSPSYATPITQKSTAEIEQEWDGEHPMILGRPCIMAYFDHEATRAYHGGRGSRNAFWQRRTNPTSSPVCSLHGQVCSLLFICRQLVSTMSKIVQRERVPDCNLPRLLRLLEAPTESLQSYSISY
eukprot:Selendium_serpulae@DN4917_c0_g1_i1.p1